MPKSVVGLFANTSEAQKVKHELVNQGYSASNIQVVANDATTGRDAGSMHSEDAAAHTGWGAKISHFFHSLTGGEDDAQYYTEGVGKGGALLSLTVPDGQEEKAADLLEHYGARNVEDEVGTKTPVAGAAPATAAASGEYAGDTAIPVVQEELQVGKRQVQRGGVRVYSHMVETPVEENVQLREEHVRVDRQTVNRPATEADFNAFKEGTMELTENAEEAVVSKNARVVEEIALGKQSSERTETIKDTVRHTEVEVEQLGTKGGAPVADYDTTRGTK